MHVRLFSTICCLIIFSASTIAEGSPNADKNKQAKGNTNNTTVEVTEAPKEPNNTQTTPKPEKVERFVMPFTKWVENKLHSSPVVNPTNNEAKRRVAANNKNQMRTAIRRALKAYPGTVLSVDKSNSGLTQIYKVKIISKSGIVKIVTIQMDTAEQVKDK